jgi:hypothetical protein
MSEWYTLGLLLVAIFGAAVGIVRAVGNKFVTQETKINAVKDELHGRIEAVKEALEIRLREHDIRNQAQYESTIIQIASIKTDTIQAIADISERVAVVETKTNGQHSKKKRALV